MSKVFFLDNQDSFTYNLVEELRCLNIDVVVYRNNIDANFIFDQMMVAKENNEKPVLFLSPGPGEPSQAGCMMTLIKLCVDQFPIIGICLGHQALAEAFGGKVTLAGETVHGKSSIIDVTDHEIFNNVTAPVRVARYHSLIANELPSNFELIANFENMNMGMVDAKRKLVGFQFHPESILTTQGSDILKNSINFVTR